MSVTKAPMTEAEFMRLSGDGRKYELIDGEAREVPAGHRHDAIIIHLAVMLWPYIQGRGVLAGSQAGFRMRGGNIRCPDLSLTLKSRLPMGQPPEGFGDGAPDLCIEVIFPSEDRSETDIKLREYCDSGAREVWHLFPETEEIAIHRSLQEKILCGPHDMLPSSELLAGFQCLASELFEVGL